jgi:ThiF family
MTVQTELVIARADWEALVAETMTLGVAHARCGRARASGRRFVAGIMPPEADLHRIDRHERLDLLEIIASCDVDRAAARLAALGGRTILATLQPTLMAWSWDPRAQRMIPLDGLRFLGNSCTLGQPILERRSFCETSSIAPIVPRLQRQLAAFGEDGQRRLSQLSVALVGCGGTGGMVAQLLALMGIGQLRLYRRRPHRRD